MPGPDDTTAPPDPRAPAGAGRTGFALLLFIFLLSGVAGLVYQVVWTRRLFLTLGATSLAISTILTAFMAGLALGGLVAGRLVDRCARPLIVYALLEVGIGLYGAATPWLLDGVEVVYHAILRRVDIALWPSLLLRFALAFAVLIVPTGLMGATLPVLARQATGRLGHVGRRLGLLYGVNTLGAALGVVWTGFILIPALGLTRTILAAAALNAVAAVLAWGLNGLARKKTGTESGPGREEDVDNRGTPDPASGIRHPESRRLHRWILLLASAGGFASFLYEIAWTRVLTLVLGGAVQAFTVMLATFLAGLAIGSVVLSRRIDRSRDLFLFYAVVEGLAAAAALAAMPLFGELPWLTIRFFPSVGDSHALRTAFEFAACFAVMIVPTFLIGVTFPVIGKLYARDLRTVGRRIGEAYFANTLGGIAGSFAAGFLLLPLIGMERTLIAAALINTGCAVAAAGLGASSRRRRTAVAAAAVAAPLLLLVFYPLAWPGLRAADPADPGIRERLAKERAIAPRRFWDPRVLAGGIPIHAAEYAKHPDGASFREHLADRDLLFYEEGLNAVVTVTTIRDFPTSRSLQVNGKTDASNLGDLPTEILLGALPMLIHPAPEDILVIGLGSGITAGTVTRFDEARRIDAVEIEAAVVRAALLFDADNHGILPDPSRGRSGDPRLTLVVQDARHVCAVTPRRYDVVLNQPSNPWLSGPSHLFTLEHFRNLHRVLKPGGIAVQWFQTYGMTPDLVRSVVRTYREVFPQVLVLGYPAQSGNLFLFGADRPVAFDRARLRDRMARDAVRAELARAGYDAEERLLAPLALQQDDLDASLAGGGGSPVPLNTDDTPVVEFEAPRHRHRNLSREVLDAVFGERTAPWPPVAPDAAGTLRELRLLPRIFSAHEALGLASGAACAGEAALRIDPEDDTTRARLGALCVKTWRSAQPGETADRWAARARTHLDALVRRQPLNGRAHERLGLLALHDGDPGTAARHYENALAAGRRSAPNLVALGEARAGLGRHADAAQAFDEAAALDPDRPRAWLGLAEAYAAMGRPDRARETLERWLKIEVRPLPRLEAFRRLKALEGAKPRAPESPAPGNQR